MELDDHRLMKKHSIHIEIINRRKGGNYQFRMQSWRDLPTIIIKTQAIFMKTKSFILISHGVLSNVKNFPIHHFPFSSHVIIIIIIGSQFKFKFHRNNWNCKPQQKRKKESPNLNSRVNLSKKKVWKVSSRSSKKKERGEAISTFECYYWRIFSDKRIKSERETFLFRHFITVKHFPMLFWIFSVEITAEKGSIVGDGEWKKKVSEDLCFGDRWGNSFCVCIQREVYSFIYIWIQWAKGRERSDGKKY